MLIIDSIHHLLLSRENENIRIVCQQGGNGCPKTSRTYNTYYFLSFAHPLLKWEGKDKEKKVRSEESWAMRDEL